MKKVLLSAVVCMMVSGVSACGSGEKVPLHIARFEIEEEVASDSFNGLDLADFMKDVQDEIVDGSDPYTIAQEKLETYFQENYSDRSTVEIDDFSLWCDVYSDEIVQFAYDDAAGTSGEKNVEMRFNIILDFSDTFTSFTDVEIRFEDSMEMLKEIYIFAEDYAGLKTQILPTENEMVELARKYLSK